MSEPRLADAEKSLCADRSKHSGSICGYVRDMNGWVMGRNGKRELVYSNVLNVNRVKNLSFSLKAVAKPLFLECSPWVVF